MTLISYENLHSKNKNLLPEVPRVRVSIVHPELPRSWGGSPRGSPHPSQILETQICIEFHIPNLIIFSGPKGPCGMTYWSLIKTWYMILAPKFFFCNKMTTARRPMDLFEIWDQIQKAGIEIYNLAVSKHDLKPFFRKNACDLGFAG